MLTLADYATIAGLATNLDPAATVTREPLRGHSDAADVVASWPHWHTAHVDDPVAPHRLAREITDRLGANWGSVQAVVVAQTPRGDLMAFAGALVGVTDMVAQFANGTVVPLHRVTGVGMN